MTSSLPDISKSIEPNVAAVLIEVSAQMEALDVTYVIVGAAARDLVMNLVYGAGIQRATSDLDLAIAVDGWSGYERVKQALLGAGYRKDRARQRLFSPTGLPVDIIPFGGIETPGGQIGWPPDGSLIMDVRGFSEACASADRVLVRAEPAAVIPVASPVGMMLLKVIAWTDRSPDRRQKDAQDISYLLGNYEQVEGVLETLYEPEMETVMEALDWDVAHASAYLLGRRVRMLAGPESGDVIHQLAAGSIKDVDKEALVTEMTSMAGGETKNRAMLNAFFSGFNGEND